MKHLFNLKPLPEGMNASSPTALVATWFGVGRLRPAPGTLGTLAAAPFGFVIMAAGGPLSLLICALVLLWVGSTAAQHYGQKSGSVDDQSVVVDEVVGFWLAALPAATVPALWLLAFLLFRFFDIYKPWPASYFDNRKKGGFDVMMDDVVAGVFAMGGVALLALQLNV